MEVSREEAVQQNGEDVVLLGEKHAKYFLTFENQYTVFDWEDCPLAIRQMCTFNGGDEDWVTIREKEPEVMPFWLEKTGCFEVDIYRLNGVVIYVGSHSLRSPVTKSGPRL